MTDLKKTIELYKGFGIECVVVSTDKGFEITLESGSEFDGYGGFYSTLFFDLKEKFIKQGFWE